MDFRKVKKQLVEYGIRWDPKVGKGSHGAFHGLSLTGRTREVYIIPKSQQRETARSYLKRLVERSELPPDIFD